ncbi:hypothetical protein M5K25_003269 [Dendrobium thyrsiflorum]|uniref:Uncharacterized protein n=1 Tax=Dendrobium thyrsiflorum TaxID=117978 RepID=A0ABD0VPD7_DENTH
MRKVQSDEMSPHQDFSTSKELNSSSSGNQGSTINEKSAPSVAEVRSAKGADVAAGQLHVIRHLGQQKQGLVLWIKSPSPHRGYKILSLRPGVKQMSKILNDEGVGGGGGARDGSRKCETALFAVDLDGPVLRLGAKDDAATGTKRGFLAAAADLSAGEGGGGAAALVLLLGYDGAVDYGTGSVGRGGFENEEGIANLFAGKG